MPPVTSRIVRVGAVTADLMWVYRRSCSDERFDLGVAQEYIRGHVARSLAAMDAAAARGAALVVGPEYFRGSELFTTSLENTRFITEPVDGPTTRAMGELARRRGVYLAAAFDTQHGENVGQTGVLVGPDGALVGHHIKQGTVRPAPEAIPKGLELWDTPLGRTGIAVCADAEKPRDMWDMGQRGMKVLILPGCGFMGKHWREFAIVRAIDQRCAVVYADEDRALIVDAKGEVQAETHQANDVIVADVTIAG